MRDAQLRSVHTLLRHVWWRNLCKPHNEKHLGYAVFYTRA